MPLDDLNDRLTVTFKGCNGRIAKLCGECYLRARRETGTK